MIDRSQVVVLAAGQGTRMRSRLPKPLHRLAGRPLVAHCLEAARAVTSARPIVVVAPGHTAAIRAALGEEATLVPQAEQRGTGDALRSVPDGLRSSGTVLVLSGDVPLVRSATLATMLDTHAPAGVACTLLAIRPADPEGLGRVETDASGRALRVVEERDLHPGAAASDLCNAGVYVFDGARLWPALDRLRSDNAQGELYLTDVVEMLAPAAVVVGDPDEAIGINTRRQLAAAEAVIRRRVLDRLMDAGVTVEDPTTTFVDDNVQVGVDTVLRPMTTLRGETVIGDECEIGPMAQLRDVHAGDRVHVGASTLDGCDIAADVEVGQYVRIRPDTRIAEHVHIGTHAEVKNSVIGAGTRIGHFSCVLDSDVGRDVNIGAGTVTCNFDGIEKNRTVIEDGVFVGSDCMLVAPLRIGAGAYLGSGSVITKDVPAGALAVERGEQRTVVGWAERRRARALAGQRRGA